MDDNELITDEDIKAVEELDNPGGIALELLKELKVQNGIADKHNKRLCVIIGVLITLLAGVSLYHEYQWSQFDTISVDTQQGGNASYIGGNGDVNNYGENSSSQKESNEQEEIKGNID